MPTFDYYSRLIRILIISHYIRCVWASPAVQRIDALLAPRSDPPFQIKLS